MSLQGFKALFTELIFCIILHKEKIRKSSFRKKKGAFLMKLSRKG